MRLSNSRLVLLDLLPGPLGLPQLHQAKSMEHRKAFSDLALFWLPFSMKTESGSLDSAVEV